MSLSLKMEAGHTIDSCEGNSFKKLVESLNDIFQSDHINVETINKLFANFKPSPQEWKKYAKFDQYRYTRNLIDEGNGKYNLMLLCWGFGHGSAIHDHADAHCFMKILQGSLSEVRFNYPDGCNAPLQEISRTQVPTGGLCYINDSMGLHRVENPSHTEGAISLHLYCPPFGACHVFNQQTGQRTKSQVTFWSKYGKKPEREIQDSRPPEDN